LERICNDTGFATTHKRVLTSEGNRRADLEIGKIRVAQQTNLLVDVNLRHNFIGSGQIGQHQGQLRNPDHPDHILESAAADKIRNYRDAYRRNRHVAFLPAFMSTSGRIHGELLRLIFFVDSMCVCVCVCVSTHMPTYMQAPPLTHIPFIVNIPFIVCYIHIYTYTQTHTHTHTHTRV
jgi:hypothetical protein